MRSTDGAASIGPRTAAAPSRYVGLRLAVLVCSAVVGSWRAPALAIAETTTTVPWLAAAAPQILPSRYNLAVVPVPPPPSQFAGATDLPVCPVAVRALVVADRSQDHFAVVVDSQGGEEASSQLVRVGQTLRFGGALWQVREIRSEQLVLARGDLAVRCALAEFTR